MSTLVIQIGSRFGRLTVEQFSHIENHRKHWKCRCDCGVHTITPTTHLKSGNTKSCGCIKKELCATRSANRRKKIPEYVVWMSMRNRCNNQRTERYADYGGRGIRVCERWDDFSLFLADVGERPTPSHQLDRIDNDGNYEPGNVRWAVKKTQARNKRNNRMVEFGGKQMPAIELSELIGMKYSTLMYRLDNGFTVEEAATTPILHQRDYADGGLRGERNPNHKLTWEVVFLIRKEFATGTISRSKLAKKHGVSPIVVQRIINNTAWVI